MNKTDLTYSNFRSLNFPSIDFRRLKWVLMLGASLILMTDLQAEETAPQEVRYFDIWEYQVTGNTLLNRKTIESGLSPYLGAKKSLQTVEQAREFLQNLYKYQGYPIVVVSIPPQNVIGGKVTLNVVEGKIDRLKVSGNKYFSRRELRNEVPSLAAGNPLNMETVRKEVDEANMANPYRSIVPVIRPGRHQGTMEMELKVRDRLPINATLETNNRYTANTSETRLSASIGYDNLWQKHHTISMGYQMAPQVSDEVSVFNVNYAVPLNQQTRLVVYGVNSDSRVATITGQGDDLTVLGNGKVYGVRSVTSLPATGRYFHSFSLGLDYKDFGETQSLSNEDDETRFNVPISYGAWVMSYNGGYRDKAITLFSVDANFGLRGINDQEEFEFKRFLAKANYFYLKAKFSQRGDFTNRLGWNYEFRGQFTESPLISNEQFSAGGVDTVRGYLESSAIGDNGLLGRTAVAYAPFKQTKKDKYLQNLNFSLFVDAAQLHTLNALPDADGDINSHTALLGAGIGAEIKAFKYLHAAMYYAYPFNKLDNENFEQESRLHFSLAYRFR